MSPPDSFMPTMFGCGREPRHRGRQQVDAGDRGEVVEQDRHRRGVRDRRVVTDERVAGHLRLEETRRADEHGVGAELGGALRGADRRLRRFAAGADDERPCARHDSRAATIAWSDSKSSISAASPFEPRTTNAGRAAWPPIARAPPSAARCRRDRRSSNGVGIGAKTPAKFISVRL